MKSGGEKDGICNIKQWDQDAGVGIRCVSGKQCLITRQVYLARKGQSALCGLAFLSCIVENCRRGKKIFLRNFQKSFRFAMPRCVLVLRGGEKPAALESVNILMLRS